jgi:hypothetical protein
MFPGSKKRKKNRSRLGLELLGARVVPAVVVTTLDLDGDNFADDIRVVGDGQNSKVTITNNADFQMHVQIDANGNGSLADPGDMDSYFNFVGGSVVFDVQLKGGNDTFSYIGSSSVAAGARILSVDLGSGGDVFSWIQTSPVSANSRIDLDVVAGSGADTLDIDFGSVLNSLVSVRVDTGGGSDKYDFAVVRLEDGASMDVDTDLGAGFNTHTMDIKEVGKNSQAYLDVSIVGGKHADKVQVLNRDDVGLTMSPSHLSVTVDLLGGNDTYEGIFTGGDFLVDDNSQATFVVRGGTGNDNLSVRREGSGFLRLDPGAMCIIDLDGGAGNDIVSADFGGTDAWQLGSATATLKMRLEGGLGDDILSCLLSNNAGTTGKYDVALHGGAGSDVMTFNLVNNGGTPTFGPAGGIILDGGAGIDTLTNGNKPVSFGSAFETVI